MLAGNQVSQSSARTIFLLCRSLTYTCLASTAACALDISALSNVDLHVRSRVASTAACALDLFSKMASRKTTLKNLVVGKKQLQGRGKGPAQAQQMPWGAKGWTRQQCANWKKQCQPANSSNKVTINPSWWAGKGMQFKPGGQSLHELRYFQKHTQLLVRKLPFSR